MTELLPCPFCGEPPHFDKAIPAAGLPARIECTNGNDIAVAEVVRWTDEAAIAAWNTRRPA